MTKVFTGSPNFTSGRNNTPIDRVIIHWMDGTLGTTDQVFQDTSRNTSAHYGIEDDNIHQYVQESDTAYHSGDWGINLRSIGIEHSAQPGRDASLQTYATSGELVRDICNTYGIPMDREHILKHMEVTSTQCPGTVDIDLIISIAKGEDEVTVTDENFLNAMFIDLFNVLPDDNQKATYIGKPLNEVYNDLRSSQAHKDYLVAQGNLVKRVDDLQTQLSSMTSSANEEDAKDSSLQKQLVDLQTTNKDLTDKINTLTVQYEAANNPPAVLDKTTPSGKSLRTFIQGVIGLYTLGIGALADPTVQSIIAVHPILSALPGIAAVVTAFATYVQNKLEETKQ